MPLLDAPQRQLVRPGPLPLTAPPAAPVRAPAPPGWRRRAGTAARLLVAAALAVAALRAARIGTTEVAAAWAQLRALPGPVLAAALALQVTWAVALARVLATSVAAAGGRIGPVRAQGLSMAGFSLSRVVPGGGYAGGLLVLDQLRRRGLPLPTVIGAITTSWSVSTLTLAGLVCAGLLAADLGGHGGLAAAPAAGLLALAAAALLALVGLCSPALRHRLVGLLARLPRKGPAVAERVASALDGRLAPRALARPIAWSALGWCCDILALQLAVSAAGHPLALGELVVVYATLNALNSLPELTPGWIGVFEAAAAASLTAVGVPPQAALAAVVVYRVTSFWLPALAGAPVAVALVPRRRGEVRS